MIRLALRITITALARGSFAPASFTNLHVVKQNSSPSDIAELVHEACDVLGYPELDRETDHEIVTLPGVLCPLPFALCLCPLPAFDPQHRVLGF